jgi:N-methylhydantoinase B
VGAAHQNCVTVVAPIHVASELLAWAGATLHVVDVGGATAGQVAIGARSIFDEAPVIPPLKIVRGGVLQADAEASYLRRSRTPELNALDLRAKVAALHAIAAGLAAAVQEFGAEAVRAALAEQIDRAEVHLQRRLAELPDGEARHVAFVDRSDTGERQQYEVAVALEKRADRLVLDFGDSSDQAPAVVNCTRSGLLSAVLVGVLTTLVWDGPWCPAAIERVVEVRSRPGSIVDAAWPAGCSMATMAGGFAATTATTMAIGQVLVRDPDLRAHAMAAWAGAVGSIDVFGHDAAGRSFGTVMLDTMASGTGATVAHDGIDTGGFIRSLSCVVANVEHIEAQFPLLYLYRRQEPDTGGAGRRRGGVGVGFAIVPHGVEELATVSPHFSGTLGPESLGLAGGGPGAMNTAAWARHAGIRDAMTTGRLPADPAELGARPEVLPGVAAVRLGPDDALLVAVTGGGGIGDPLERDPLAVAADVEAGLVTRGAARDQYGIVLTAEGLPDEAATRAQRLERRADRWQQAGLKAGAWPPHVADEPASIEDGWVLPSARCGRCGQALPVSQTGDPLANVPVVRVPIDGGALRLAADAGSAEFELLERYCPHCLRRLRVDRVRAASRSGLAEAAPGTDRGDAR